MLLLLDNLEQVAVRRRDIAALLASCPNLQLLATSRALLRIAGEREYQVLPLPEREAVALFLERAAVGRARGRRWREICRRLDGLPLAIELAAARTRVLAARAARSSARAAPAILTAAPGTRRSASGRCERRSNGATTCSREGAAAVRPARGFRRELQRSKRRRRYAAPTSRRSSR